jgi:hypothetical protein
MQKLSAGKFHLSLHGGQSEADGDANLIPVSQNPEVQCRLSASAMSDACTSSAHTGEAEVSINGNGAIA